MGNSRNWLKNLHRGKLRGTMHESMCFACIYVVMSNRGLLNETDKIDIKGTRWYTDIHIVRGGLSSEKRGGVSPTISLCMNHIPDVFILQ